MIRLLFATVTVIFSGPHAFSTQDYKKEFVEAKVEEVNSLREKLVKVVPAKPTAKTFKAVCKPIGMKAKRIGQEHGWSFKQVSLKNRNPKHAANAEEKSAIERFEKEKGLKSFWTKKPDGRQYFRRITVKAECLACHGSKDSRPEFVVKKYPKDLAFNFKQGDLRGVYSIFVPHRKRK